MLAAALGRVLRRPGLIVLVWSLGLLPSALGLLPGLAALNVALSTRPAARALVRGEADVLWAQVFSDDASLLPVLATGAVAALVLSWLLSTVLSGGLVAALRDRRASIAAAAAASATAMLRLACAGWLLRLPVVLLGGLAIPALAGRQPARSLPASILTGLALALILGLLWCWGSVILHVAQARLTARGQPARALPALRWALRSALRPGSPRRRCLLLAGVALLGYGILIMLTLGASRGPALAQHAALLLLARQVLALGRAALGLSVLGAAVQVVDEAVEPVENLTPDSQAPGVS